MTPAEIYESKAGHFMSAAAFEGAGIKLVDNTPEEILAVVKEMTDQDVPYKRFSGYEVLNIMDDQKPFWDTFPRSVSEYSGRPLHGKIRMRIGAEFLRGYQ